MKASRPTSVLIFLGTCLAFVEALVGVVARYDAQVSGVWILAFGTLNLLVVLGALLLMFFKNPQFLIAERRDLIPLHILQAIRDQDDPKLIEVLIKKVRWESLTAAEANLPEVAPAEAKVDEAELRKFIEEQAKLKGRATRGGL
jgi:hypothetical protein